MRLELHKVKVRDVRWGDVTKVQEGVLYVDKARHLSRHLTARADDSHATPVLAPSLTVGSSPFQVPTTSMSNPGKVLRAASN